MVLQKANEVAAVLHSGLGHGCGTDLDHAAGMRAVGRGDLQPFATGGARDQKRFAMLELVTALKDVDAARRDPLPGTTGVTGAGHLAESVPKSAVMAPLRLQGESAHRPAGAFEEPNDMRVRPEGDFDETEPDCRRRSKVDRTMNRREADEQAAGYAVRHGAAHAGRPYEQEPARARSTSVNGTASMYLNLDMVRCDLRPRRIAIAKASV
jgi:hypothetical protein